MREGGTPALCEAPRDLFMMSLVVRLALRLFGWTNSIDSRIIVAYKLCEARGCAG